MNDRVEVVSVWGHEEDIDLDERLILWLSHARTEFPGSVIRESEEIKKEASKNTMQYSRSLKNEEFEARKFFRKEFPDLEIYPKGISSAPLQGTEKQIFPTKKSEVFQGSGRTDFRDWYTLTIDGSDAKDLDDAISIRQEQNGDYTLAVHIADVAEYVTE